ncbi:hypothetical protein EDB80DRAFT_886598 [Ilyonectria destructans]|nr:hypothetical protein EDB80DRAFT_886598 [Ilyonectria destructans]
MPKTDIATRALIVVFKSPSGGKTTAEVAEITGLLTRTINGIYARAIERGFDPNHRPMILHDEYLRDAERAGRPKKQTDEARIEIIAKRWDRDLDRHGMANTEESRVPEDEANKEAWVDEEYEAGTSNLVS